MSKGVGIAGGEHSLYFDKTNGKVYSAGACGLGWCRLLPLHQDLFGFRKVLLPDVVTKVHASYYHNLAVTRNNRLFSWGCGTFVEGNSDGVIPALGPGADEDKGKEPHQVVLPLSKRRSESISQVTGGAYHSAVLLNYLEGGGARSSEVLTFGAGQLGQLGRPISGTDASGLPIDSAPKPVHGLPKNDNVQKIGAGFYNTFAICESGKLFCTGENQNQQCGSGPKNLYSMTHVKEIEQDVIINKVEGGYCHTLIQTNDGKVYSMGCGDDGQRGDGRIVIDDDDDDDDEGDAVNTHHQPISVVTPVRIPVPAQCVAAGANHSVILGTNGVAYTFGSNDVGQCGIDNEGEPISSPTPVKLPGKVATISAGYAHTILTTECGNLYVFGQNDNGQLGLGSNSAENPESKTKPIQIPIPFRS
mmetsp:Transcript_25198/g.27779  ORF Transcript_25198/g.27779 Transcript_25198/m.27779 type:complete len:417 (-) Transcript_25198:43-1293(-)|eukprot:CAMPEP_0194147126 /NCGR_PEP_ID=MMETSP0152-20130528/22537_1 /TAXON_ID=1049557 /ORGANISM="Thalassiothrix antarctica, Strain L6-D1" /LENGTH=416 /DNA_ID=CAMNT_0038847819 /DNA_START=110 /DNA_END=1360 /DNA_ORIENTATION=-